MADTNFVNGTVIVPDWLNDVNNGVYKGAITYTQSGGVPFQLKTKLYTIEICFNEYGAVGDGVTDDTAAIQNAINNAPAGSVLVGKPGSTYLVSKASSLLPAYYTLRAGNTTTDQPCIAIYQKSFLTIDGKGSTIKVNQHGQGIFDIVSSSNNITIRNFIIQGPGNFPQLDGTTGRGEKGIVGAGYYDAGAVAYGQSRNNSKNTSSFNTGGFGGAFPQFSGGTAATWGTWNGGYICNSGSGIFIGDGSNNIVIEHNTIFGFNEDAITVDSPLVENYGWAAVNRVVIKENYLYSNYNSGINYHNVNSILIKNNYINNNGHPSAVYTNTVIDPGYGIASFNGTAPQNVIIDGNIIRGNKRKAIDAHSIDTAIITNNICTDSGYGIMVVNGSLGTIRNIVISNNYVARIVYPVSAQATGIYVEKNVSGAAGFAGNVLISNNVVTEVGVPPGTTGYFTGTNPYGIGILLAGTLTGATVSGNLIQNNTYLGWIGICSGFAGGDVITGSLLNNTIRGPWTTGINNSATGGTNSSTTSNSIEITSVSPYVGAQTGIIGATDRYFYANNINVPAGQSIYSSAFLNLELIVRVTMTGTGSTTWAAAAGQSKYLSSVASSANGLQFNLAPGVTSQAITWAQTSSSKLIRTAGAVVIDHIYVRTENSNTPTIGLQSAGVDNPSNNCTGSITFKILI